jgi:hypothetical protein
LNIRRTGKMIEKQERKDGRKKGSIRRKERQGKERQ